MKPIATCLALGLASIALAACGEEPAKAPSATAKVGGKILERSITDEMLPYDTVRSQPPRAKPDPEEDGPAGDSNDGPADESAAEAATPDEG